MNYRPDNVVEQPSLKRLSGDAATIKAGLAASTNIGRRKTAVGDAKHRQIVLAVADGECLCIWCQHPVAERCEASPLIDFLGDDNRVDYSVVGGQLIELEVLEQLIDDMG